MEGGERMRAVPGVLESANGGSGLAHVPKRYVVPSSHRPNPSQETANVPVIDLRELKESPAQRSTAVEAIGHACRRFGIFHVVNHGICQSVLEEAISAASSFFNLPMEEKVKFMSGDVHKPVRYGTGFNSKEGVDRTQYWRLFLKHYAHPLQDWIGYWPENPPAYREKMGKYSAQVRRVAMELTEAITESLGIGSAYLTPGMSHGMQVMAVNCYPPCPNPDLALGLPAHSDYGCLTVLLQSLPGLQIMDAEDGGAWKLVPKIDGALQVHVGDHIEVLSNGLYKSLVHRAILNSERTRISIASLHSLGMDEKMGTAKELVSEHHPMGYHESSFRDFLNFLPASDFAEGKSFIRTLRTEK